MEDLKAVFIQEADELIQSLEDSLLLLENHPEDKAGISSVFRSMHTLKGSSSMFGFDKISDFTHTLENLYDLAREGNLKLTASLLTLTLACVDHLKAIIQDAELEDADNQKRHADLTSRLHKAVEQTATENSSAAASQSAKVADQPTADDAAPTTWWLAIYDTERLLKTGNNPLFLFDDLAQLGSLSLAADDSQLPGLDKLKYEDCYLTWKGLLVSTKPREVLEEAFLFVQSACTVELEPLAEHDLLADKAFATKWEKAKAKPQGLTLDKVKGMLPKAKAQAVNEALQQTKKEAEAPAASRTDQKTKLASIRVDSDQLDKMMNLVSELVTTQARLSMVSESSNDANMVEIAENMEKISRQLRETTFGMSLVPVESLMTRFRRLVRDLSLDMDKKVEFVADGTDTKLDKNIIESLADPLLHIIRNSMDHGLESTKERKELGKPETATLRLHSYYSGTFVYIRISDDGRGINKEKVLAKAVKQGLVQAEDHLSHQEIYQLIFAPGFSTADKVTGVSGRGVGMDVVRRKIRELRGDVEVESTPGQGTAITLKIPLSLSIMDGLLVQIEETFFVIPLESVYKCYEVLHQDLRDNLLHTVTLDGEKVPLHYLRKEFAFASPAPVIEQVVVVQYKQAQVALTVDQIIGDHQAVLQPLGRYFRDQDFLSGATILGDGTLALVLDTTRLIMDLAKENQVSLNEELS